MDQEIGFFRRLGLAFAVLFDPGLAAGVSRLKGARRPELPAGRPDPASDRREALHVLAMLQREGRLIDFLEEDISGISDGEVGVAARTVHDGCKKTLAAYLTLEPVLRDPEEASVVVEKGFDARSIRLTGNVVGDPPFKGILKHHGWRAREVKLPAPPEGQDPAVLAPAEVELP